MGTVAFRRPSLNRHPRPGGSYCWGNLLTNSSQYFFSAPWQVFFPGVFIFIALMSFNLLGDGLRDALDPRLSERGR